MIRTHIPTATPKIGDIVLFGYSLDVNDGGTEYRVREIRDNGKQVIVDRVASEGWYHGPRKVYVLTKSRGGYYTERASRVAMNDLAKRSWRWEI